MSTVSVSQSTQMLRGMRRSLWRTLISCISCVQVQREEDMQLPRQSSSAASLPPPSISHFQRDRESISLQLSSRRRRSSTTTEPRTNVTTASRGESSSAWKSLKQGFKMFRRRSSSNVHVDSSGLHVHTHAHAATESPGLPKPSPLPIASSSSSHFKNATEETSTTACTIYSRNHAGVASKASHSASSVSGFMLSSSTSPPAPKRTLSAALFRPEGRAPSLAG